MNHPATVRRLYIFQLVPLRNPSVYAKKKKRKEKKREKNREKRDKKEEAERERERNRETWKVFWFEIHQHRRRITANQKVFPLLFLSPLFFNNLLRVCRRANQKKKERKRNKRERARSLRFSRYSHERAQSAKMVRFQQSKFKNSVIQLY